MKKNLTTIGLLIVINFLTFNISTAENPIAAAGAFVEDAGITLSIYSQYARSASLNPSDISVYTTDGVVSLIGKVQTDEQRNEAIKIAQNSSNVRKVEADNLLIAKSEQPMNDTWINAKVNAVLFKNQLVNKSDDFNSTHIKVETKNGVVFLSGSATQTQAKNAVAAVRNISGVVRVENNISNN